MLNSRNNTISKAKSSRKPLRELCNGAQISSNQPHKKKVGPLPPPPPQQDEGENALDRLLLVHSDISNLIQQIDELVVQAVKVDGTSKNGKKEIDLFTTVLSDMHGSLKSWIPRFQNLLTSVKVDSRNQLEQSSCLKVESRNHLEQSSPIKTFPVVNEAVRSVDDSPELSDFESFVSPSPLVSWCPEPTAESGRQLFLLTPLPMSRQLCSKLGGSSRSVFAKKVDNPSDTNLRVAPLMKATPGKCSKPSKEEESNVDIEFASPPKFSSRNRSMLLMTPRLKMSPPKSCVLLEPIAESCQQRKSYIAKATPFRVATRTRFSESLSAKYPELFGTKKQDDARIDCLLSPLKSCVLMEPPVKKQSCNKGIIECTPMPENKMNTNKKQPGENTLKKELWTKFEAATTSSNLLRLDESVLRGTSSKGFLDRLEEVYSEDISTAELF